MKTTTTVRKLLTTITIGTIAALVIATCPTPAAAGSRQYRHDHKSSDTAAAIIGGIAVIGAIAAIASSHDNHNRSHVDVGVSYNTGVRHGPGRGHGYGAVHYRSHHRRGHHPTRDRVGGHYEVRREKITIPGHWKEVIEPAEYRRVRRGCGWETVMIKPETIRRVWVPARCEWQETKVWVPDYPAPVKRFARVY